MGVHLACQVVLRGDLEVEVPAELLDIEEYVCEVVSTRQLTPLIREVVLRFPQGRRPAIAAGTFLQVTAPPYRLSFADFDVPDDFAEAWRPLRALTAESRSDVTRAYSISNRPQDTGDGLAVLNIRLALAPPSVPTALPGIVSSWLFGVRPGDSIRASGPFGDFRAQDTEREMVLIGGGVGMAPLRAIIFDQLEARDAKRPITFFYGARSRAELYYEEAFEELARRHPNFGWVVALSEPRPEDAWDGATGFVHNVAFETLLRDHPAPEACEYYLCGPPLMIRAVHAMLEDAGVPPANVFNDDFGV